MNSRHILFETHLPNFACDKRSFFCPEVHWKSSGSPAEVQWTEDLANMTDFCPSPVEIQQKSGGRLVEVQQTQISGHSNHFLLLSGLSGLSLDFAWTTSGIQSCPTDSVGLSAESIGNGRVWRSLLDKQWECKVLEIWIVLEGRSPTWLLMWSRTLDLGFWESVEKPVERLQGQWCCSFGHPKWWIHGVDGGCQFCWHFASCLQN